MEEVIVPEMPPRLVRGVAIRILQPSWSGAFLRVANSYFPLQPNARHLKRIRRAPGAETPSSGTATEDTSTPAGETTTTTREHGLELLLAVGSAVDMNLLKEFEAVAGDAAPVSISPVWVPDRAPRASPDEWVKWCKVWPLAIPKPRAASPLPPEELTRIRRIFNENVLPLAKRLHSKEDTLGIAAVLVDSAKDWRVLTTNNEMDVLHRSNANACFGYMPVSGDTEGHIILDHPVTYALKSLACIHREDGPQNSDDVPYLANSIDLFVSHEPCVMCSMALVHSRVRRVFYCFENPTHGGLGSVFSIHAIPSLNHHFRVFRCSASWLREESYGDPSCSSGTEDGSPWECLRTP